MRRFVTCMGLAFLGFFGAPACTTRFDGALDAFQDGRLPEAASDLRAVEQAARRQKTPVGPRYALYRGLVELGLGNARAADRWLGLAHRAEARGSARFDERERGELRAAWQSLGHMPGQGR